LTDKYQVCVRCSIAKLPVSGRNELKVLFDAYPSNVNELGETVLIFDSVFFPISGSTVAGMKAVDVYPTVEQKDLPFPKATFMKQLGGGSRWNDHFVNPVIEHHHVLPCERFKADVPRVVLDILWNVGVIRRRCFNLKCLCRQQSRKPNRSWGADLHFRGAFFLEIPH